MRVTNLIFPNAFIIPMSREMTARNGTYRSTT